MDNIETYKQNIVECEDILKQLNPQFAIDKERDERLSNLENRFDGVESKLDKIFNLSYSNTCIYITFPIIVKNAIMIITKNNLIFICISLKNKFITSC